MKEISLYIHIPFCKQKCFYCDFSSFAGKENLSGEYVEALCKEIRHKAQGYIIKTIFIGGGTPSYLNVDEIEKLLGEIKNLKLSEDIEFTMECNPGTLTKEKLIKMREGGVNRISFGLQSCEDSLLKQIGRIHSFIEFEENFNLAREIGFKNINVDLMYGLPNQSVDNWKNTLQTIIAMKPEHISAYSLIIEEGTAFYSMYEKDLLKIPSEDDEREMDALTKSLLNSNGYHQYEISNYSLDHKECEHNKVYWSLKEYIGLGSSSSSYLDGKRKSNVNNIEEYIKKIDDGQDVVEEVHENSIQDEMEEFIFMGLRMNDGINIKQFNEKFGVDIRSIYETPLEKNIKRELLIIENHRLRLTDIGRELSNSVMSDFILEK